MNLSPAAPALRAGSRSADVAIAAALAALTLVIAIYLAPRGFQVGFVDMGHDGYQLRQVLDLTHGGVIFKDTFDQYGPLNGYLNAVGFITLGHRLLSMKYFICGWYALIAGLLYALSRQWLSRSLATFAVLVWVGLAPFYNHGIMISPHAYALLFQTIATLLAIRSTNLAPGRFATIGLLIGLSWAVKQSIGVLYLAAILSYLFSVFVLDRRRWRQVATAASVMSLMFAAVVGVSLMLLWRGGALHDWYLQTLEFPRVFYLSSSAPIAANPPGALSRMMAPVVEFARLQWGQPLYWIVIRAVVLVTVLVQLSHRRSTEGLVLIASITAFLWLGAYPSANFMHQWWTASLTIPAFVVCIRQIVSNKIGGGPMVPVVTVALVSVVVGAGVYVRINQTRARARTLTVTIDEPAVLRGIRTDVPTRRAFEMLYRMMSRYRDDHPGARIVSIESSDGWGGGIVESLLFISFFDDNPHEQPVYWRLPALTTIVYPRYGENLWRQVREEHPLLVEHRIGRYKPFRIPGYAVLAAAQSDYGHWYVYAPHDANEAPEERSMYLAADGKLERGFAETETVPALSRRLSASTEGGWRGSVAPAFRRDGTIQVSGDDPFTLVDPFFGHGSEPVNLYTWPADLPAATIRGPIEPAATDVIWREGRRDIVRELRPGAWTVSGNAAMPYSYLLQWADAPIAAGRSFIVRGQVAEGGLQVGFLERDQWTSFVTVTREGPFEAVIEIQKTGRYALVLANCIRTAWWERASSHPVNTLLGLVKGQVRPNRFRVQEAGWLPPKTANPD